MSFLSWGFSPEDYESVVNYGQAIDYNPQIQGKDYSAFIAPFPNVVGYAAIGHFQPQLIAQTPLKGPFFGGWREDMIPYGINDTFARYAPAQPVRYDIYEQDMSKTSGDIAYGTSPTKGIYTGIDDICGGTG